MTKEPDYCSSKCNLIPFRHYFLLATFIMCSVNIPLMIFTIRSSKELDPPIDIILSFFGITIYVFMILVILSFTTYGYYANHIFKKESKK